MIDSDFKKKARVQMCFVYLTVFITGAAVLVVEIAGTRALSPFFGVSLYVWSALISVTLVALAIGYFCGGFLADRKPGIGNLFFIVLLAGISVLCVPFIAPVLLKSLSHLEIRTGALLSAIVLFAPPLMLLGTVSPYAVKICTTTLDVLGKRAGTLYAVSTLGSCFGAILTGFILIPNLGVTKIFYLQSIVLILLWGAWHILERKYFKSLLILPFLLAAFLLLGRALPRVGWGLPVSVEENVIYKGESLYGQTLVADIGDQRWLLIDGGWHTATYRKVGESILPYVYLMELLPRLNPKAGKALVIGLGGGSVSSVLQKYGLEVKSVEIDPGVVDIARKYFAFKGDVITGDGRAYIRRTKTKYDFVVFDAYSSDVIPVHLTSREAFQEVKEILGPDGILAINCIGFLEGKGSLAYKSIHRTLRQVFPHTMAYSTRKGTEIGNRVLFASDKELKVHFPQKYRNRAVKYWHGRMQKMEIAGDLEEGIILTDDYNPIEILTAKSLQEWRKNTINIFNREPLLN